MTESERAVIPQQKGPPPLLYWGEKRHENGGRKGSGMDY